MILGIVGSGADKFTPLGERRAKDTIVAAIHNFRPDAITSGHSFDGGVDIWTEELAKQFGCYDPELIFPPRTFGWEMGIRPRNIKIADKADVVVSIVPDRFPDSYSGRTLNKCGHCKMRDTMEQVSHINSGACWTMWYAREMFGKDVHRLVIQNY